jgi:hypothetical protein
VTINEKNLEHCIRAIHENWTSLAATFGKTPQWEFIEGGGLTISSSHARIFNSVMRTQLTSSDIDDKILETIEYFSSRDLPFSWWVYPGYKPDNLAHHLEKHGLTRREGRGMALEIDKLMVPQKPEGFTIQKATTPQLIETYARLLPLSYGTPAHAGSREILTQAIIFLGLRDDYNHYVGFLDDVPVATSSILYANGVAGIHQVSTLPNARRKGIGSYISAVPLFDARDRCYKVSVLYSTPMGVNVYKRLGYVEYCQPVRYQWKPQS